MVPLGRCPTGTRSRPTPCSAAPRRHLTIAANAGGQDGTRPPYRAVCAGQDPPSWCATGRPGVPRSPPLGTPEPDGHRHRLRVVWAFPDRPHEVSPDPGGRRRPASSSLSFPAVPPKSPTRAPQPGVCYLGRPAGHNITPQCPSGLPDSRDVTRPRPSVTRPPKSVCRVPAGSASGRKATGSAPSAPFVTRMDVEVTGAPAEGTGGAREKCSRCGGRVGLLVRRNTRMRGNQVQGSSAVSS